MENISGDNPIFPTVPGSLKERIDPLKPEQNGRHARDDIVNCILIEWKCLFVKPSPEPIVIQFTETYIRHKGTVLLTWLT